jgi:hypothetical protein
LHVGHVISITSFTVSPVPTLLGTRKRR